MRGDSDGIGKLEAVSVEKCTYMLCVYHLALLLYFLLASFSLSEAGGDLKFFSSVFSFLFSLRCVFFALAGFSL